MKYTSTNKITDFNFHDAYFELVSFENKELKISAKHLNIHKTATENPESRDMEIKEAIITLINFDSPFFKEGDKTTFKPDGQREVTIVDPVTGDDALKAFLQEIEDGLTVYYFGKDENEKYAIEGCGISPFFTAELSFSQIIISWDEFLKPAWYELHRQFNYEVMLATHESDKPAKLIISIHEEDVYYQGKLEKGPTVNAGIKFEGKEFRGHGKDYLWVDALASLQQQLPKGISLKCCLTCRHGNFCPFGSEPGTIFCTKDKTFESKEDVCNLFIVESETIWSQRIKKYADTCESYERLSKSHYTYNDFLHYLNNP